MQSTVRRCLLRQAEALPRAAHVEEVHGRSISLSATAPRKARPWHQRQLRRNFATEGETTKTTDASPTSATSPAASTPSNTSVQLNDAPPSKPRTAMFFPGQGVQRVGMLKPWLEAFPNTCKPFWEEVDTLMQSPLASLIETGRNDTLTETQNAQPAIMATSIMILRVMEREFGFDVAGRLDVTLGHSLGEFAALVAGGYLRFEDALRLVKVRGEAMAAAAARAREEEGGPVGMVALVCEADRLESMIDAIHEFTGYANPGQKSDSAEVPPVQQVLIANVNSKNQVVVSGSIARIRTLLTNLREFGGHDPRAVELKSDSPFHSPLMQPGTDAMKRMLHRPRRQDGEDLVMWPGLMPCVSNITARPFQNREELKDLLARQCVETVLWWDSIKFLDKEWKVRRWIGIGPGKVGRNLVGKEVGMKGAVKGGGVWSVHDPKEVESIIRSLEATDSAEEE